MTEVYCLSPEPPVIHIEYTPDEILDWSFQFLGPHNPGLNPPRTLYVPQGSLQSYQNAPGWRSFDNIREILPVPDDIFGLRIGMPVSEQEVVNLFSERYNTEVGIPSSEALIVYHVKNIPYMGFDWNDVFLSVDKDDNTLISVGLHMFVPHNFDFAPTKEDSINIVTAKVGEVLDSLYGEPTRNLGGTAWHGPNNVDIVLGVDRSSRIAVSDPRREDLTTGAMIVSLAYLKRFDF